MSVKDVEKLRGDWKRDGASSVSERHLRGVRTDGASQTSSRVVFLTVIVAWPLVVEFVAIHGAFGTARCCTVSRVDTGFSGLARVAGGARVVVVLAFVTFETLWAGTACAGHGVTSCSVRATVVVVTQTLVNRFTRNSYETSSAITTTINRVTSGAILAVVVEPQEPVKKKKKGKKRKKKEKRSSKKCKIRTIWTHLLKFCLAVNGVFFDETLKSTSKKIVNRRKVKKF